MLPIMLSGIFPKVLSLMLLLSSHYAFHDAAKLATFVTIVLPNFIHGLHHLFSQKLWFLVTESTIKSFLFSSQVINLLSRPYFFTVQCIKGLVLEQLLYYRILDFYSDSILCHQYGFCKSKSTLLLHFDDLQLCSDRRQTECLTVLHILYCYYCR